MSVMTESLFLALRPSFSQLAMSAVFTGLVLRPIFWKLFCQKMVRNIHALDLANRVLHLASITLEVAKDWTNTSYLLELIGPSSCVMRRITFLDMSQEYIFHGTIQAVCCVRLQDGAIVIHSEDEYQSVLIRLNYNKLSNSMVYGVPAYTIEDKKEIMKVENNPAKSPTPALPNSSPTNIIRPIPTKFNEKIPPFFE